MNYKKYSWNLGGLVRLAGRRTVEFFRDTPAEIVAMGALGFALASGFAFNYEHQRTKNIPISFSEIHQLEDLAEQRGQHLGEVSEFYAKLWDANAKTCEAHNYSWKSNPFGKNREGFARELENHMDKSLKFHKYNLSMLLEELPTLGTKALVKMKDFENLRPEIYAINKTLDDAWDESHYDHYRTEVYTETETYTGSDGKSHTRTVTKTRQVYDHTTHSYKYHKDSGKKAIQLLDQLLKDHPSLSWPEELDRVKETNADGEYAAESSRDTQGKKVRLSREELLDLANKWNTSSTYTMNRPDIIYSFSEMPLHANSWKNSEGRSRSTSYNTHSRSDAGPKEFRVAEAALKNGRTLEKNLGEILDGVSRVISGAPQQKARIDEYITETLDKHDGNSGKKQKEIMGTVSKWQRDNFQGSERLNRFRPGIVLLGGLLGGAIGAGLGFGVDAYTNRRRFLIR